MFIILYHKDVASKDIPRLSDEWYKTIKTAIENKLTSYPQVYGKPLRRTLKNYRKLRVGDYRVIFRLQGNQVKVFLITHRSEVYKVARNRLI